MRDQIVVNKAMRAVKSKGTGPEIKFRKELWRQGVRYRLNYADMFGMPDLVLGNRRIVVFIDSDFWHGVQWKRRGFYSLKDQLKKVNNKAYWLKKIERNIERDHKVNKIYSERGWVVVRFLESEINSNAQHCVNRLIQITKTAQCES